MGKDDEARDALADFILSSGHPELQKYMPLPKVQAARPWYRPNGRQAIFGAVAGTLALLIAFGQTENYDGSPLAPSVIGIVLIAWALGYKRGR